MADRKSDQPDEEAVKAASEEGTDETETEAVALNPKDLGTDVEKLPPVPGAGQFMSAEESTEAPTEAATEEAPAEPSRTASKKG